jgi:hypothetical protein
MIVGFTDSAVEMLPGVVVSLRCSGHPADGNGESATVMLLKRVER